MCDLVYVNMHAVNIYVCYEHADCEEVRSFIIVYVIKCNHDGIEHVCYEHANFEQVCSEQLNMLIVNLYSVNLMIVNLNVVIMMILNMRMFPSMIFRHPK